MFHSFQRAFLDLFSQQPGGILVIYLPGLGGAQVGHREILRRQFLTSIRIDYTRFGNDTFGAVSWMFGPHGLYTANMDVARQILGGGHKTSFVKPEKASTAVL